MWWTWGAQEESGVLTHPFVEGGGDKGGLSRTAFAGSGGRGQGLGLRPQLHAWPGSGRCSSVFASSCSGCGERTPEQAPPGTARARPALPFPPLPSKRQGSWGPRPPTHGAVTLLPQPGGTASVFYSRPCSEDTNHLGPFGLRLFYIFTSSPLTLKKV